MNRFLRLTILIPAVAGFLLGITADIVADITGSLHREYGILSCKLYAEDIPPKKRQIVAHSVSMIKRNEFWR